MILFLCSRTYAPAPRCYTSPMLWMVCPGEQEAPDLIRGGSDRFTYALGYALPEILHKPYALEGVPWRAGNT